jgi:large subunit ribosomal protein L29
MSKALKAKDLRGTDPAELQNMLTKLREDLFKSRMKKSTNQLENVMTIRTARRDIARVTTILAEQQRKGAVGAEARQSGTAEAGQGQAAQAGKEK